MDKIKKNKTAVALKYDKDDTAPIIIAKGRGLVADKIIKKAKQSDVQIYEDEELSKKLINLDIGQDIPPELYTAVAELLAFIYQMDKEKGEVLESKQS